jgi:hypothetical protein
MKLNVRHHRLRASDSRLKSKRSRGVRVHGVVGTHFNHVGTNESCQKVAIPWPQSSGAWALVRPGLDYPLPICLSHAQDWDP